MFEIMNFEFQNMTLLGKINADDKEMWRDYKNGMTLALPAEPEKAPQLYRFGLLKLAKIMNTTIVSVSPPTSNLRRFL